MYFRLIYKRLYSILYQNYINFITFNDFNFVKGVARTYSSFV